VCVFFFFLSESERILSGSEWDCMMMRDSQRIWSSFYFLLLLLLLLLSGFFPLVLSGLGATSEFDLQ
jgi:hypothetical protein